MRRSEQNRTEQNQVDIGLSLPWVDRWYLTSLSTDKKYHHRRVCFMSLLSSVCVCVCARAYGHLPTYIQNVRTEISKGFYRTVNSKTKRIIQTQRVVNSRAKYL